jgi:von Willebrand factor type A domain-containing protein
MRRSRLGALGALIVISAVAASVGAAPAAPTPSATASQAPVAGSPSAIACGGSVDARVTVAAQAGTTGQATDVVLVLDVSGSMGAPSTKFDNLKAAARAALAKLDAADGAADQSIAGNGVGVVYYPKATSAPAAPVGSSYATLLAAINNLPAPNGSSPHDFGINSGVSALAASTSGYAKAMVLVTDGQTTSQADLDNVTNAANAAKTSGVRIVPIGIGTGADVSTTHLTSWGSQPSYYQSGTPGPIDADKLIADLGAAVSTPTTFTVSEALGQNFSAAAVSSSVGTVTPAPAGGILQWTATVTGTQTATLVYRATRNGNDVFATTNELVSTLGLVVAGGGSATVTPPASISIDVLPCGGTLVASTTCTGTACSASGSSGGTQYAVNAGSPPAGTSVVLAGLNSPTPPSGVCAGFSSHTTGAQIDIRPLTTDETIRIVIPKASLGATRWWQTDVCVGTNLPFTTAISSLSNLRPGATLAGGGALPSRWWGLLPSIPRLVNIPGRGWVFGPWITSRSQDSAGNAIINVRVPFITNSAGVSTDGKAGFDPKIWS